MPDRCAIVVGAGSIGQRHARVLSSLGVDVALVSRRAGQGQYQSIEAALAPRASEGLPSYLVVATETADHARVLDEAATAGFDGKVLVEKPLFGRALVPPDYPFHDLRVGYVLRFHPGLQALRSRLAGQELVSAQIHCGQYLPDWRPGRDHREGYSGDKAAGGGVLRDLSHELDYALWLFGDVVTVGAIGGTFGNLGITSDDAWGILARFERCPLATVQLDYLFRPVRREIRVVTQEHAFSLDLVAGTLEVDGETVEHWVLERDVLFADMHRSCLDGLGDPLPSLEDALRVERWIAEIEATADGARERQS